MDDTLPDPAYLEGLRVALAEMDPALGPAEDGIGVVATSLIPVVDGDWPELEITWLLTLPERVELADVPRAGTFRVPIGRTWLDLSFYPRPTDYATVLRERLEWETGRVLQLALHPPTTAHVAHPRAVTELWAELLAELEDWGEAVREVRPGRVEVEVEATTSDGRPRTHTFFITPDEWADLCNRGHAEYGLGEDS